jgi:MFS family permease
MWVVLGVLIIGMLVADFFVFGRGRRQVTVREAAGWSVGWLLVNAFAMLGLRALYFLLVGAMDRLAYLSYGLAAILAFIGAKMLLIDVWHPPFWISLVVIVGLLALTAVLSLVATPHRPESIEGAPDPQEPAREPVASGQRLAERGATPNQRRPRDRGARAQKPSPWPRAGVTATEPSRRCPLVSTSRSPW